jgi:hypothetical protein
LQRENARALRGEIIEDTIRGKLFERSNIIGALCNGTHYAVACYKHTTDSVFFERWFNDCLLKVIPSGAGYTIIMDNASFHRKQALRKLARSKVRLLFLPPYSPDYNSIEKSWANMKQFLRSNLKDYKHLNNAVYNYFGASAI